MPLKAPICFAGETLVCLLPQIGTGCSIEGWQAVTKANFCPWNVTTPSNSSTSSHNSTAQVEGWGDDDEEEEEEATACNRMQDFRALVDRAEFEGAKEQKEGHIRSNSLVFNTFIFLQVRVMLSELSHAGNLATRLCLAAYTKPKVSKQVRNVRATSFTAGMQDCGHASASDL